MTISTTGDEKVDAGAVIQRLGKTIGATNDEGIAQFLGVSRTTVTSWRGRNAVPYAQCAQVAVARDVSLDWLIFGNVEASEDRERYDVTPARPTAALPTPPEDAPIALFVEWLQGWWAAASPRDRAWMLAQLGQCLPEYLDWLHQGRDGR